MKTIELITHMNEGKVFKVSAQVIKNHELYLLKHTIQIFENVQLSLGPLNKLPSKQPQIPVYINKQKTVMNNESYMLEMRDQAGETKIDESGRPLGARQYLVNTFLLPNKPLNLYTLITDLMKVLGMSNMTISEFMGKYYQLCPILADSDSKAFLKAHGLIENPEENISYVTVRSAFISFGAAIIMAGTRISDDYWEHTFKDQGFSVHHRVFVIPNHIITLVNELKSNSVNHTDDPIPSKLHTLHWESPLTTIMEQPSWEIRKEYAKDRSQGDHSKIIVPGQNIIGAIELGTNYKIPKYHYKNSFLQAYQYQVQDIPIGMHQNIPNPVPIYVKPGPKRLTNGITDVPKLRFEDNKDISTMEKDPSLNINGWKFESLPLSTKSNQLGSHRFSGLPFYNKDKLVKRLKLLTPNQIKELEHVHDSVHINNSLHNTRRIRKLKWEKYWQYKAGVPIGLLKDQLDAYKNDYLPNILAHVDEEVVYNDVEGLDEIYYTKRIPNPNFLGYSNICGLKPPYVNKIE